MATIEKSMKGRVLRIQRLSTEDGPGIRSTVFLKGCGLSCTWCHNPESLSFNREVQWPGIGCLNCGICVDSCEQKALSMNNGKIIVERSICTGCGNCVDECPTGALEILGEDWTAQDLVNELEKDRSYFEAYGGGITLSGGEAVLQDSFTGEILKLAKERGLSTALDTCGFFSWKSLETILPWIDLVLYDLKLIDGEQHRKYTGADNSGILANAVKVSRSVGGDDSFQSLWIRTPIIPGVTDTEENITAIGRFISDKLGSAVHRWELCAFNNLCRDKYTRLDKKWDFESTSLINKEEMESLAEIARKSVPRNEIVSWSGTVDIEKRR